MKRIMTAILAVLVLGVGGITAPAAQAYQVPVEHLDTARTCTAFGVSLWDTRSGEPGVAVSAAPGGEGVLGASPTDTMTAVFTDAVPATAFDAVVTVLVDGNVNNTVTVAVPAAEGCGTEPPVVDPPTDPKAEKAAQKAADKAEKAAQKAADKAEKAAQKAADKAKKAAQKAADKAKKAAQKAADKAEKGVTTP